MSNLVALSARTAYIPGVNNIGVIEVGATEVVLVDSGIDKDAARQIRTACTQAGKQIVGVISTHHHADHIGGNAYLCRNIEHLQIYASPLEAALIEYPMLEPMYLSYGAAPVAPLQNRFVMATAAPVHQRIDVGVLHIAEAAVEIVAIPGHSVAQIAVVYDGVCFAADAFLGVDVLAKHGLPYAHDVRAQQASLQVVAQLPVHTWIPGHGPREDEASITATLAANQQALTDGLAIVADACLPAAGLATVVARVQQRMGKTSTQLAQYAVFASGVMAYLQTLHATNVVDVRLSSEGPLWERIA